MKMKMKIGSTEYEVVTVEVVKPDGRMVMSDGKKVSCDVGLKGPHAKVGDEYAIVGAAYVPVGLVEGKSWSAKATDAPPTTTAAAEKKAAAAAKKAAKQK